MSRASATAAPPVPPQSTAAFLSIDRRGSQHVIVGSPSGVVGDPGSMRGHGIHFAWQWDGERLTVQTDRYGLCPAFVWVRPEGITIAPGIDALLALGAPRDLDLPAIGIFARLGFYIDQDTPFRHIRALPPGCRGEWREGRWAASGSWPQVPAERPPRPELVRRYAALFDEAVRSCVEPGRRIIHPLSGGLDSRHVLLALRAAGALPERAVTYGSWEGPVAAHVAAHVGVPHQLVPVLGPLLDRELRKDRRTWWLSDEHAGLSVLGEAIDAMDPQREALVLDGLAGGILSGGRFVTPERAAHVAAGRWGALAESIMPPQEPAILHPDVRSQTRYADARERLAESLRSFAAMANPASAWFLANRTRREIALSPFVLLGAERARAPWFESTVFDFLSSLPADLCFEGDLHRETLAHAYPDASDLPVFSKQARASSGLPLLLRNPGELTFARDVLARLAGRQSRLLHHRAIALRIGAGMATPRRRRGLRQLCNLVTLLQDLEATADDASVNSVARERVSG